MIRFTLFMLGLTASTLSWADDVPSRTEFNALEQRVEQLEHALQVQQAKPTVNAAPTLAPGQHLVTESAADHPDLWKTLQHGMSQDQVKSLLGAPSRTLLINHQDMWYYETRHGNGSLIFNHDLKLDQVQPPPLH